MVAFVSLLSEFLVLVYLYDNPHNELVTYLISFLIRTPFLFSSVGGYSYEDLGAYVVAPCTHDRPCPLATGVWCSFSQKVKHDFLLLLLLVVGDFALGALKISHRVLLAVLQTFC